MQSRPLLDVLVELENLLPDIQEGLSSIKNELESVLAGNSNDIQDRGNTNLFNLVKELELIYNNFPAGTLEKNLAARTKNAIYLGNLHVTQTQLFMAECIQTAFTKLNEINPNNTPTNSTSYSSSSSVLFHSASASVSSKTNSVTHSNNDFNM